MRLSDIYLQFRRQRSVVAVQPKEPAVVPRHTMTLEAMTRPAQTKSLKTALRQR